MTKYWVFTQGGAWRNLKPTGSPYGRMRQLRGAVVGGNGGPRSSLVASFVSGLDLDPLSPDPAPYRTVRHC